MRNKIQILESILAILSKEYNTVEEIALFLVICGKIPYLVSK
jgi:hypothetical protein